MSDMITLSTNLNPQVKKALVLFCKKIIITCFQLRKNSRRIDLSHSTGLSISGFVCLPQDTVCEFFSMQRKKFDAVFIEYSHVDNGQSSCGGSFDF